MADTFALIAAQRLRVADMMDTLNPNDWAAQSLCGGWTNHAVAAHLVMPFQVSTPKFVLLMAKAKGNFDKASNDFALKTSTATPAPVLAQILRANAEHRFTPPGFGPEAPLTDITIHGLDIATPLGRSLDFDPEASKIVLDLMVSKRAERGFRKNATVEGFVFKADDADWSYGSGLEVHGPASAIIQALSGRSVGFAKLAGEGVAELQRRLAR